jgi:hypothetical protein
VGAPRERWVVASCTWRMLPFGSRTASQAGVVALRSIRNRKPRRGATWEALCRTRTGDPFLTMAVRRNSESLSRLAKLLHTRGSGCRGMPCRPVPGPRRRSPRLGSSDGWGTGIPTARTTTDTKRCVCGVYALSRLVVSSRRDVRLPREAPAGGGLTRSRPPRTARGQARRDGGGLALQCGHDRRVGDPSLVLRRRW